MLCDICKKNQATIHVQEIDEQHKQILNLCEECARKHNPQLKLANFNLAEMLYNLEHLTKQGMELPQLAEQRCAHCSWDLNKLREFGGRLGCQECYKTFAEPIEEALKRVHRGLRHVGKHPGQLSVDAASEDYAEMRHLQRQLNELIRQEEYEMAAEVRDRINLLKRKNQTPPLPEVSDAHSN